MRGDMSSDGRGAHPRPQLQRAGWRSLDGEWEFAFDTSGSWAADEVQWTRRIVVPFPPESAASGIGDTGYHNVLWYRLRTTHALEPRQQLLLHFGAVDYHARVWVNGTFVVEHVGGHTPFVADVSDACDASGRLDIVVRVEDEPLDLAKPRGKQDWLTEPHEIWYPRTSGMWQTVWLESVPDVHVARIQWTPYLDRWEMGFEATLSRAAPPGTVLHVTLHHQGVVLVDDRYGVTGSEVSRRIALVDPGIEDHRNRLLWSPAHPTLIEAELELSVGEQVVDAILRVVRSARPGPDSDATINNSVAWGPSPRASQALMLGARAKALLDGRLAPSIDDVADLLEPVFKHRMALNFQARADGRTIAETINHLKTYLA